MKTVSWMDRAKTVEGKVLYTIKQRKANWIGHILRRNCLLRHINGERWKKGRSDGKKRKKTKAATR